MKKKLFLAAFVFAMLLVAAVPVLADEEKPEETVQTGWIKESYTYKKATFYNWYYADSNGELVKGWDVINGVTYYFSEDDGRMYSDGIHEIDGNDYFFYLSGALGTGWIYDDVWYYADSNGVLQSGWQTHIKSCAGAFAKAWACPA